MPKGVLKSCDASLHCTLLLCFDSTTPHACVHGMVCRWPHLGNALKYATAMSVSLFGTFQPQMKSSWVWVFCFVYATLYQFTWDVVMDWDLLRWCVRRGGVPERARNAVVDGQGEREQLVCASRVLVLLPRRRRVLPLFLLPPPLLGRLFLSSSTHSLPSRSPVATLCCSVVAELVVRLMRASRALPPHPAKLAVAASRHRHPDRLAGRAFSALKYDTVRAPAFIIFVVVVVVVVVVVE